MKSRFINEEDSDNEDRIKEENMMTSIVESTVQEIPVEKSPDDEIAELMLKLNGQVDEELVASIRSRKKKCMKISLKLIVHHQLQIILIKPNRKNLELF